MTFYVSRVTLYVTRYKSHFAWSLRFCHSLTPSQAENMDFSDEEALLSIVLIRKEKGVTHQGPKRISMHIFSVKCRRDTTAYVRGAVKIILTPFVYTRDPCPFMHVTFWVALYVRPALRACQCPLLMCRSFLCVGASICFLCVAVSIRFLCVALSYV